MPYSHFYPSYRVCRLWPLTVGLTVYLLVKHPSRFLIAYSVFFLLTNRRDSHHTGSQVSTWLGKGALSRAVARYLNASLHTPHLSHLQALASNGTKFVFAVHPQAMFGPSTLVHFALNRLTTREILGPSVDFRVMTINLNFFIPILREYLMARGFVSADKSAFASLIQRGISPVIVPGGSQETLYAYPGSADLVVNKRLGFVREALRNGAWLVPVYCFGDTELVPVIRTKRIVRIQRFIQKFLTFATPLVLPYIRSGPIRMVIGDPLAPPTEGSFDDKVTAYHAKYLEALRGLFNAHVGSLGTDRERTGKGLRFVK